MLSFINHFARTAARFSLLIGLIGYLFLISNAVAQSGSFSKLIVFGDSLSDTGNLAVIDLPPPYFQNRISDGPVVADLLAEAIGSTAEASGHLLGQPGGSNFAVAGGNIKGADPEDLTQQVSAYLQRVNSQADPDALYLVFVGGNDLRNLRSTRSPAQATVEIALIIDTLATQLNRLKSSGARAFLIPNVANIGRLPETLEREVGDPGISERADLYTREYNRELRELLANFGSDSSVSVSAYDLFKSFENVIENASDFGFTNTTEGCFDPDEFEVETECLLFGFDRRIFFDRLHPSSASNRIIANQVIDLLPMLPVEQRPAIVIAPILNLLLDN